MARLDSKIEAHLGRKVNFSPDGGEVHLTDDGSGVAVISKWDAPEPQPTEAELSAADGLATTAEANVDVIANRQKEYGSIEEQIEFITENGLTPWQTKVDEIKAKYPKQ
jgi:hypothetical protein